MFFGWRLLRARTTRLALWGLTIAALDGGCSEPADDLTDSPDTAGEVQQALACDPNLPTRPCVAGQVCPPGPPACGPGSESYPHGAVTKTRFNYNIWGDFFTLYEPASPRPVAAPVIVFFHGWAGVDPSNYDAMLTHWARRGYIAVFAMYGNAWAPAAYEANARTVVNAALAELGGTTVHVRPERDPATQLPRVAFAGHSLGGVIALRLAATVSAAPLIPRPQVIALHDASTDIWADPTLFPNGPSTTSLLPNIAASTRIVAILRAESLDVNAYSVPAFTNTTQVPRANKNIIQPRSDSFGNPDLYSDHFSTGTPIDALDYWGYWRPSEGAFNASFGRTPNNEGYDPFCSAAGAACAGVRNMGTWLNSTQAVTPARNAADLGY
jgi:pimeloyl-ACP methyl ester carboxylesterase